MHYKGRKIFKNKMQQFNKHAPSYFSLPSLNNDAFSALFFLNILCWQTQNGNKHTERQRDREWNKSQPTGMNTKSSKRSGIAVAAVAKCNRMQREKDFDKRMAFFHSFSVFYFCSFCLTICHCNETTVFEFACMRNLFSPHFFLLFLLP